MKINSQRGIKVATSIRYVAARTGVAIGRGSSETRKIYARLNASSRANVSPAIKSNLYMSDRFCFMCEILIMIVPFSLMFHNT